MAANTAPEHQTAHSEGIPEEPALEDIAGPSAEDTLVVAVAPNPVRPPKASSQGRLAEDIEADKAFVVDNSQAALVG